MIVLDLDGTILDCSRRHYGCYARILAEADFEPLPFATYWAMKRRRQSLERLLGLNDAQSLQVAFAQRWLDRIEEREYLALDTVQPGAAAILSDWKLAGRDVIVVTSRRQPDELRAQLEILGLADLVSATLTAPGADTGEQKAAVFLAHVGARASEACCWVGDTEIDVQAARCCGLPAVVVECGLRDAEWLRDFAPDFQYADLVEMARRHPF